MLTLKTERCGQILYRNIKWIEGKCWNLSSIQGILLVWYLCNDYVFCVFKVKQSDAENHNYEITKTGYRRQNKNHGSKLQVANFANGMCETIGWVGGVIKLNDHSVLKNSKIWEYLHDDFQRPSPKMKTMSIVPTRMDCSSYTALSDNTIFFNHYVEHEH